MASQYLCGTARSLSSHIVHDVPQEEKYCELQFIQAFMYCGATSIHGSPQLGIKLEPPHEAAHITTRSLTGEEVLHGMVSHNTAMLVQGMDDFVPIHEEVVLIIGIGAYDLVQ
jgi:hypothetical protein